VVILTKYGLGFTLDDVSTNSSGHPDYFLDQGINLHFFISGKHELECHMRLHSGEKPFR
jgi:hypothetical protein